MQLVSRQQIGKHVPMATLKILKLLQIFELAKYTKSKFSWDVMPCSLVEFTDMSKQPTVQDTVSYTSYSPL
jgi:hypothetical protein